MALPAFALSLIDAAGLSETGTLDYTAIVRVLKAIEARLNPLEAQSGSLAAAIEAVRKVGLDRINEVLVPAIQLILDIQSKGFMIAASSTPATMVVGDVLTFVIDDEGQRALFTPSDFVGLTRASTPNDYAVLRTVAYTTDDGEYIGQVVSFEGDPGPHSDWVLGALAGSTMASVMALDLSLSARADAVAAAAAAVPAAATATAKATIATDAAAQAVAAALAAATFDPAAYYPKTATYSKTEVDTKVSDEATARTTAVSGEATARADADAALSSALTSAIDARVSKLPLQTKTANFAAASGNAYLITAGITCTFPMSPSDGNRIGIVTESAIKDTPCTVNLNGATCDGSTADLVIGVPTSLVFEYYSGAWRLV